MNEKISRLHFYSLGIVAANKALDSDEIEVTAIEENPMLSGDITDNVELYKATSVNSEKDYKDIEVQTTLTIKAKWLPINNSNRMSSPDVRRGETVVIYKFADVDKYWWNTLYNDSKLRRLETVIYGFVNDPTEGAEMTKDNSYWFEVNTHRKLIHLHTSKNDKEPFSYDIQLNTKEGIFTITDDVGNYVELNSRDTKLTFINADEASIVIDHRHIQMECDTMVINAKDSFELNTTTSTNNSSGSVNVNTPTTNISDKVNIGGDTATTGTLTNNGVDVSSTHIHGGVVPGPGNTNPPN